MSNTVDAINQIMSATPGAAYDTIKDILASKVQTALKVRRVELANGFVSDEVSHEPGPDKDE